MVPSVMRQPGFESCARRFRRFRHVPAPQVRDAVHVHVDADALVHAPGGGEGEEGHFGADAGQRDEALEGVGDVVVVLGVQDVSDFDDVFGLDVVEADLADAAVEADGVGDEDVGDGEAAGGDFFGDWVAGRVGQEVGVEALHG